MNLRQAAQQALEALTLSIPKPRPADDDYAELGWKEHNAAITALRAALAEPEQESFMVVAPECAERGCMAHDDRVDGSGVVVQHRKEQELEQTK